MSDLDELFRRDPLGLTQDPNVKEMVAYYRTKRQLEADIEEIVVEVFGKKRPKRAPESA